MADPAAKTRRRNKTSSSEPIAADAEDSAVLPSATAGPSTAPPPAAAPMPMPHPGGPQMRSPTLDFTSRWSDMEVDGVVVRRVHPDSFLCEGMGHTHPEYDAILEAWSNGLAFTDRSGDVYELELVAQQREGHGEVILKDDRNKQFPGGHLKDQTLVKAYRDDNARPLDYQVVCEHQRDQDLQVIALNTALVGYAKRVNFVLPWRDV